MRIQTKQDNNHELLEKNTLQIKIIESTEDFEKIKSDWDQLVDSSNTSVYQKYCWLFFWWKHYNNPDTDKLFILTFYDNDKLVGIAPFYINQEKLFKKILLKRIYFLGSETFHGTTFGMFNDNSPSDYLDIICHPNYEELVLNSLTDYLILNHHLYDEIILTNLNTDSIAFNYLPKILENKNVRYHFKKGEICPYIKTPKSFDDFLNTRTQSVKRRLTQSWKEAQSGKLFKIIKYTSFEEIQTGLNEIKKLHQKKWNRMGFPGFFGDARYEKFFQEFLFSCYPDGLIWCGVAKNDNRTIAGRLAFVYKGKYYDYLSGIDDKAPEAKRRPGLVLLMQMIKDAIENKKQIVDLLRGDESYKKDFTEFYNYNWNLWIYIQKSYNKNIVLLLFLNLKLMKVIIQREISLLKVWIKEYRFPISIFKYSKNRIKSLVKKLRFLINNIQ